MPCITVPLNLLEIRGVVSAAFDFQLRPVGHHPSLGSILSARLRFKDLVFKHEHGRVKCNSNSNFQRTPWHLCLTRPCHRHDGFIWSQNRLLLKEKFTFLRTVIFRSVRTHSAFAPRLCQNPLVAADLSRLQLSRNSDGADSRPLLQMNYR